MDVAQINNLPHILNISSAPSPDNNNVGKGHFLKDNDGNLWFVSISGKAILVKETSTDWVEVELLNDFDNYGNGYPNVAYKIHNGVLYIRGVVKDGKENSPIFRLPYSVYEKISTKSIHPIACSGESNGSITISSDGYVKANKIGNIWTSLECSRLL
jgi:hypothetical protein